MGSGSRFFVVVSLFALAAIGSSQSASTIPIAGHVTDLAFQPIPNVTVTLKAIESAKQIARVETDQAGVFRFPAVPPGVHELHFEKAGFSTVAFPIQVSSEEGSVDFGSVILQKAK